MQFFLLSLRIYFFFSHLEESPPPRPGSGGRRGSRGRVAGVKPRSRTGGTGTGTWGGPRPREEPRPELCVCPAPVALFARLRLGQRFGARRELSLALLLPSLDLATKVLLPARARAPQASEQARPREQNTSKTCVLHEWASTGQTLVGVQELYTHTFFFQCEESQQERYGRKTWHGRKEGRKEDARR